MSAPEVTFTIEKKGTIYGFVKVNVQWETCARVTTQGFETTIMATFPFRPIKLPGAK